MHKRTRTLLTTGLHPSHSRGRGRGAALIFSLGLLQQWPGPTAPASSPSPPRLQGIMDALTKSELLQMGPLVAELERYKDWPSGDLGACGLYGIAMDFLVQHSQVINLLLAAGVPLGAEKATAFCKLAGTQAGIDVTQEIEVRCRGGWATTKAVLEGPGCRIATHGGGGGGCGGGSNAPLTRC